MSRWPPLVFCVWRERQCVLLNEKQICVHTLWATVFASVKHKLKVWESVCVCFMFRSWPVTPNCPYSLLTDIPEWPYNPNTNSQVCNQPPAANIIGFNQTDNPNKRHYTSCLDHTLRIRESFPTRERDENNTGFSFEIESIPLKYFWHANYLNNGYSRIRLCFYTFTVLFSHVFLRKLHRNLIRN